jgi:hypothetical protein
MKQGRSLIDLATEVQRQVQSKRDFLADTRSITMYDKGNLLELEDKDFEITSHCHHQIGERLQIPRKYYDRMRVSAPALLTSNVNHWFKNSPETRMIRTLDGRARAFLSDRYRPLDNFDLMENILQVVKEKKLKIVSAELTETRLYLKIIMMEMEGEVKPGDPVQAGVIISNSEIGMGSVNIQHMINRLVCSNGMIVPDSGLRRFHIGRRNNNSEDGIIEYLKDETKILDDKAFWAKIRDIVEATLNKDSFDLILNRLRKSTENKIEGNPVKVVEEITKRYSFSENEKGGILNELINGGDLSMWGLANAVTATSQKVDDYDRATDLEKIGGQIIELPKQDWNAIAITN